MKRHVAIVSLFVVLISSVLTGCKPRVPGKYISPGKMEDILYDYHLASAASNLDPNYNDTLRMQVYKLAVLKKYNVSEADFDSSMVYYTRHADRLHRIYENLSKRMSNEALALGASTSEVNQHLSLSQNGDTANVWTGDLSFILTKQPGFNCYPFSVVADSSFHAGDRFVLSFNTKFIFQEGMREGVALIALCFNNDSIASRMIRVSNDNSNRLEISDDKRIGIKKITGYFLMNKSQNSEAQTTLKLMHVGDIALFRIHTQPPKEADKAASDSASVGRPAVADSDSLRKPMPVIDGRPVRSVGELPRINRQQDRPIR